MSMDLDDARGSSRRGRPLLLAAGIASAAISVLHLVIVFAGAPAHRYVAAGEGGGGGAPLPGGAPPVDRGGIPAPRRAPLRRPRAPPRPAAPARRARRD